MTTARSLWNGRWVIHDHAASPERAFVPAPDDLSALPPKARHLVLAMVGAADDMESSARIALADDDGNDAQLWIQLGPDRTAEVRITGSVAAPIAPTLPDDLGISDVQLLDLAHQGLWVMDPQGRTAYVNPRMAAMLGADATTLTGRALLAVVHEDDRADVIELFDGRSDDRNAVASELREIRLRSFDGTIVWTAMSVNRIVNAKERTSAIIAVVTDHTVHRIREAELRAERTAADDPGRDEPAPRLVHPSLLPTPAVAPSDAGVAPPLLTEPPRPAPTVAPGSEPASDPAEGASAQATTAPSMPTEAAPAGAPPAEPTTTDPTTTDAAPPADPTPPLPPVASEVGARPRENVVAAAPAMAEQHHPPRVVVEAVALGPSASDAYRAAFTHAPVGMAIIELDGNIREANPAMEALLDPAGTANHPMNLTALVEAEERDELTRQLAALRAGMTATLRIEVPLRPSAEGSIWTLLSAAVVTDRDGRPAYAIAQAEDITERRVAEHDLVHQTLHDPLTGLGNRLLLRDQLQQALSIANEVPFAVMFLDLDRFKSVNDTYGHDAGDALLVGVSQRLRRIVRAADTVARLGGDEFAIIAQGVGDREGARILAEKVRAALRAPFRVGDIDIAATASVGIVIGNKEYATGDQLLRDADIAMYRAKDGGRDRHELFDDEIRLQEIERLETERTLHAALDGDGLKLHYQPIIDLHTGRAVGAEALLRVADSNQTLLTPSAFLGVAEDSRLILDVGAWVLREVCTQLARWTEAGFGHLAAWVNVTGLELASPRFASLVQRSLSAQRIDASRLHLECTENVLLEASPSTIEHLRALAESGVSVGIDDFGTGYSSLGYLRDLPVDFLKIDAAFTRRLDEPGGASMVEAMVGLGRSLGLRIVAEGVESHTQMEQLAMIGCDLAQGHLFARPGPIDTLVLSNDPESGSSWP